MANIITLTSLDAPELDVYARLTQAQLRNRLEPEKGLFIAESPKVIGTALSAGLEPVSFLMEQRHITGDAASLLARFPDVPVYTAERELLARLTGYTLTRGVLCAMRRPAPKEPDRGHCGCKTDCGARGRGGCNEHRSDFPLGGSARHGRGAAQPHVLRPSYPARGAREHGNGLSAAVGDVRYLAKWRHGASSRRGGFATCAMALQG